MTTDDTTPTGADVRAARRAQREAERAARAQRKADAARQRAMEAARAGGLFEGMEAGSAPAPTHRETPGDGHPGGENPRARTSGTADPAPTESVGDRTTAGPAPAEPAPADPATTDPARTRRLTAIAAAVSVVLLVVTGVATWQYIEARQATATEESIAGAPAQATDAAREIATQMFTYDHRTVDADLAAVRERLTEPALSEFVEQSMPAVSASAKQREAAVYATVAAAAPQEVMDSDHVTVLVMLNRMVSSKESPEAASSASRLSLQMSRVDGQWKLSKLEAL